MILAFGPVSGAHLNPLVTMAGRLRREIAGPTAAAFVVAQIVGAGLGVVLANIMFELPAVTISTTDRSGWAVWLSEAVATFGLVVVVRTVGRRGRTTETAFAVAAFIGAAIVFTPSTSFANPAVTLARTLTDTFAGIAPSSVPPFLTAELAGALIAVVCDLVLHPDDRRPTSSPRPPGVRPEISNRAGSRGRKGPWGHQGSRSITSPPRYSVWCILIRASRG
jgi:glycerol uptake facilitator-like aquaporin